MIAGFEGSRVIRGLEGTIVICFASFVVIYFVSFIVATGYQLWAAINDARRANVYQSQPQA